MRTGSGAIPERQAARFLAVWRLSLFLLAAAAAPPAQAQNWTVYNNVKYGFADPETADFHVLDRGVDPVVVFIHGGGWQAGNKSAYAG